jgi:hypothetical protein
LKIAVVIPLWKRPEVTKFCFDGLLEMISKSKHEYTVTCAISEKYYESVCEEYGFDWVFVENEPLGNKINEAVKKALKTDCDYIMMMNSDDVIDAKLIDEFYENSFIEKKPFFGINRVTYVNFYTKEARDYTYSFSCLGIGKMIRRDIVEKAFKYPGYLYKPELNRCLDDTMMDNLIRHQNVFPTLVKYDGQLAWDYKSETNIWSWDTFKNKGKEVCYKRA